MLPTVHPLVMPAAPPELAPTVVPERAEAMIAAAQAAAPAGMSWGAAVLDVATGDLAQAGAGEFYSASLSKLMLIVDMLDCGVDLSEEDSELIGRALSLSDDNAMNALWVRFDGPGAMTRVAENLGLPDTSTPEDPSQWGETEVSPVGFARLFQHILTVMDPADRAVIVDGLSAAQQRAADGFDQFFGLLGQQAQVYAKQGWMYYGSQLYLHSAGVVHAGERDYVVVLMTRQPISAGAPDAVSAVASAMLGALSG
jgi:hypothetical protein